MKRNDLSETARPAQRSGVTGRAASLFAAVDWDAHPLGPRDRWPISLQSAVRSLLSSSESMFLVWGEHRSFFFNDSVIPGLGPQLDYAMGARFEELLSDVYPSIEPFFLKALNGESSRLIDMHVPMARWGEAEDTWWTFSYTPVFDDDGSIAGVLCIINETTATVAQAESERRAIAALVESERSLRRAQEAGQIGIFAIDIATGILKGSAEFCKLFGIEPMKSMPAAAIEALVVPEDAAIISHDDTRVSQQLDLHVEYRVRRPDNGEIRCIERRAEF